MLSELDCPASEGYFFFFLPFFLAAFLVAFFAAFFLATLRPPKKSLVRSISTRCACHTTVASVRAIPTVDKKRLPIVRSTTRDEPCRARVPRVLRTTKLVKL